MAKQNITKKYTFSASGVLNIEDKDIVIDVEERGKFSLRKMLSDFDGRVVKLSCNYDEDYEEHEINFDGDTGEIIDN